jgi:hypothetical protein
LFDIKWWFMPVNRNSECFSEFSHIELCMLCGQSTDCNSWSLQLQQNVHNIMSDAAPIELQRMAMMKENKGAVQTQCNTIMKLLSFMIW